jgi:hypoxanthine phosphoribosyltransferase
VSAAEPLELPRVFIPRDALSRRVQALGAELSRRWRHIPAPLFLVLMDGAFIFAADVVRAVHLPGLELRFVRASSYRGMHSTGTVALEPMPELQGRHVLLIDDILDTGTTLAAARQAALTAGAQQVETCVLCDKPARRRPGGLAEATYVGFRIPDIFVVGYGLDVDGRWRELPYIGVVA